MNKAGSSTRMGATYRRLAAIQSSYVPWKGYFDLINLSDVFVLYDDVQYTKNDWRNRNLIRGQHGAVWLTIPVRTTGRFGQRIDEAEIGDSRWATKHWNSLQTHYARASHFDLVAPHLRELYRRAADEQRLSRVNEIFLRGLCEILGISTTITRSSDYRLPDGRVERLVELCRRLQVDEYVSGPSARAYLDEDSFGRAGIALRWMDYSGYPEYRQLHAPPFIHQVSVLDLLLCEGPQGARRCLLTTSESTASTTVPRRRPAAELAAARD